MPVGEKVPNHFYITVHFYNKQDMIPLACVRDPACNRDPASISANYIDPRPLSVTRLLPEVLRYSPLVIVHNCMFGNRCGIWPAKPCSPGVTLERIRWLC